MIQLPTVVVDVGNSAIKMASAAAPLRVRRVNLREPAWHESLAQQVQQLRDEVAQIDPLRWVVASVNGPASEVLRQLIAGDGPGDTWLELSHRHVPIRFEVRRPEAVGIDRLLSASAAWHAVADSPGQPHNPRVNDQAHVDDPTCSAVISIDAGSAVTVDLVRRGVFAGGAILPGLRLQLASLTQGTDKLPAVSCNVHTKLEIPGRDTVAAIQSGVILGLAGGIDRLIEQYSQSCDHPPRVFLTGGDACLFEPLLEHRVSRRDDLVLSAIADIAAALGYDG